MATYTVQAPDGHTITLEGPDGANQADVIAQAQQLYTPNMQVEKQEQPQNGEGRGDSVLDAASTILGNALERTVDMPIDTANAIVETPVDPMGALRLFETAPEIATRVSRGDNPLDAGVGAFDYVIGVGPSAIEEESAKLAATYNQDQPVGQFAAASLMAMAKMGGIPTTATGAGFLLTGLEKVADAAKITKAGKELASTQVPKLSATSPAGKEEVVTEAVPVSKQLDLPVVGKQEEMSFGFEPEKVARETPTRNILKDADELTEQLLAKPKESILPDAKPTARSKAQKVGDAKRKAWLESARKATTKNNKVKEGDKVKDSLTLNDKGHLILKGPKNVVAPLLKDMGVTEYVNKGGVFIISNKRAVEDVLDRVTNPTTQSSYGSAPIEAPLPINTPKLEREAIKLAKADDTVPAPKQTPEETAMLMEAETARVQKVEAQQLELFTAKQMPAEQLALQLGEDTEIFLRRGGSNASVAEAGERIRNPEVDTLADVMDKVDDPTFLSKVGSTLNFAGGKAISPIRELGRYSPSIKRIADMMGNGLDNSIQGFHAAVGKATGTHILALQDALESSKRAFLGISKKSNDSLVRGLRGLSTDNPKEVAQLRSVLNNFHKYMNKQMEEAGVQVGYTKNFYPRRYNIDLLKTAKGKQEFIEKLLSKGFNNEEAHKTLHNILENGGFPDLAMMKGKWRNLNTGAPVTSSIRGRKLDLTDEELAPFLRSDNIHTTLTDYMNHGIKVAEYTRRFGKREEVLDTLIKNSSKELARHGKALTDGDMQHIGDVADSLVHAYRPIDVQKNTWAGKIMQGTNRVLSPAMHVITLPLVVVSSISEPMMILGRASLRPTSALKAVPAVSKAFVNTLVRAAFKGVPKSDAIRAVEDVGLGLDAAISERLHGLSQGDFSPVSSMFFKMTLLHDWTKLTMVAANESGKHMIKGHLRELSLANITASKQSRLSKDLMSLGIDPSEGMAWLRRGAQESDPFFETFVKAGAQRFVTDVVMVPRSTELPMWHSNPHYKLISQLKGFPTMFGNTVVKNWFNQMHKGNAKQRLGVAATATAATYAGMLSNEMQDYIRYGEKGNPHKKDWEPYDYMVAGMDRFGLFGMASSANTALKSHEFGRDGTTTLLGPAISKANDALGIFTAKDAKHATAKFVAENTPFVNVNREVKKEWERMIERQLKGL